MSILDFKPYRFPIPASAGWDTHFNADEARAYIAPREKVTAFLIPPKSKRYVIATFQTGFQVFDRMGKKLLTVSREMRDLAARTPPKSVIDSFISPEGATVIDILWYHDTDIRRLNLQDRLGLWWYLPDEYRNRYFFNETNSAKLNGEIFQNGKFSKIIFKPDFVKYPRASTDYRVYNWLEMRAPKVKETDARSGQPGNLSNLLLRRESPRGFTRSETITP